MGDERGRGAERAAAVAASHPACPPPITTTSNFISMRPPVSRETRNVILYFPTHNRAKISPSTSSTPIRPTIRSIAAAARRRSSAISSGSAAPGVERRDQRLARVLKSAPMPFKRQQGRLVRRHALFREIRKRVKQPIDPCARFCRYGEIRRGSSRTWASFEVDLGPAPPGWGFPYSGAGSSPPSFSHSVRSALFALRRALATPSCSIGIVALAHARGVDQNDRIAAQIEKHLDQIAGRSGDRGSDRHIAASQRVHQGRLADVGGPGDDDGEALPQALRRIRGRERPVDPLERGARRASHRFKREIRTRPRRR